ncbi:UNVERIFIED_CONTAM: hypothetical protein FKN15_003670 [Acipenser sinensis]
MELKEGGATWCLACLEYGHLPEVCPYEDPLFVQAFDRGEVETAEEWIHLKSIPSPQVDQETCLTCLKGEEWCFAVSKVRHKPPDQPPPWQEVELLVPKVRRQRGGKERRKQREPRWCTMCIAYGHEDEDCPEQEPEDEEPERPRASSAQKGGARASSARKREPMHPAPGGGEPVHPAPGGGEPVHPAPGGGEPMHPAPRQPAAEEEYLLSLPPPPGAEQQELNHGLVILQTPPQPVFEGDTLTLRCHVYHYTATKVVFYKDNEELQSQAGTELSVDRVSKSDEGFYKCRAEWWYSSTYSGVSAEVRVSVRALFSRVTLTASPGATVKEGEALNLTCEAAVNKTPRPELHYTIVRDGEPVTNSTDSALYSIASTEKSHTGSYTCAVESQGVKKSSQELHIEVQSKITNPS